MRFWARSLSGCMKLCLVCYELKHKPRLKFLFYLGWLIYIAAVLEVKDEQSNVSYTG